ncbi:MAG: ATP-binding protein [Gammaproteobacteria bacterium]
MKPKILLLAKFNICLSIIFLTSITIGYYSVSNLNKSTQSLKRVYSNQLQSVNFARTVQLKLTDLESQFKQGSPTDNVQDKYTMLLEDVDVVNDRAQSEEGKSIIKTVKTKLSSINLKSTDVDNLKISFSEIHNSLEELVEFESAHAFNTVLEQKKLAKKNLMYTNGVYLVGLMIMALMSLYLLKAVVFPLRRLTTDIRNFRDGTLDVSKIKSFSPQDEIGEVTTVFKDMALTISKNEVDLKNMVVTLRDTNEQLAEEVTERKKAQFELELTLQKMIKLSRQAGMFEVASELLHNVGNILNSVHTSIDVLGEMINSSTLKQSIDFLLENKDKNLKIEDERVKLIFDYLSHLSTAVETETDRTQSEVVALKKKIENLTVIIQAQQQYAKPTNVMEQVNLNQIIEESLAINEHILDNHGISIERHFGQLPESMTDKHKVMQIFVNFIVNAKQALLKGASKQRVLRISTELDSKSNQICIRFKDNGIGIDGTKLKSIFHQSVDTKMEEQGFGLHSSANMAQQLGGRIEALSNGLNQGTEFILYLPVHPVL